MASTTIQWLGTNGYTWNPVTGCTPVSAGCDHCYARRMAQRLRGRFGYDKDNPFKITVHAERMQDPLLLCKPRMIFVCSMGDPFHPDVSKEARRAVAFTMCSANQHEYLILTKRPERIEIPGGIEIEPSGGLCDCGPPYQQNVLIGTSIEDQPTANLRLPEIQKIGRYFISVEPMLGPIKLAEALGDNWWETGRRPEWVICGGETGPGARRIMLEWVAALRKECRTGGIPFFLKSWGGRTKYGPHSDTWREVPQRYQRFFKGAKALSTATARASAANEKRHQSSERCWALTPGEVSSIMAGPTVRTW